VKTLHAGYQKTKRAKTILTELKCTELDGLRKIQKKYLETDGYGKDGGLISKQLKCRKEKTESK